jgi:hypothetical protein
MPPSPHHTHTHTVDFSCGHCLLCVRLDLQLRARDETDDEVYTGVILTATIAIGDLPN